MVRSVPSPMSRAVKAEEAEFRRPRAKKATPKVRACPTMSGMLEYRRAANRR
jgi:hypothetical protein